MHILIGHTMAYGSLKQFLKSERKKRHETGTNEVGGENYWDTYAFNQEKYYGMG